MARRYRLPIEMPRMRMEERVLRELYPRAQTADAPTMPEPTPAPLPPAIEEQVYGAPEAERNTILLRRLFRETAVPAQRSRTGIVE